MLAPRLFSKKFAIPLAFAVLLTGCGGLTASLGDGDDCHARYELLNKTRRCKEEHEIPKKREYEEFEMELGERIAQWEAEGMVTNISVYFRDLESGPWFGIDEKMEFYPASLLKTPIMMAVLKQAESDPAVLDEIISYDVDVPAEIDNAAQGERIETYTPYPLREVIRRMMAYSDNRSQQLLLHWLYERGGDDLDLLGASLDDLGLLPTNGDLKSPLTVKSYSSLFRSLYNAQYLNREMSQIGLSILGQSNFKSAIVAGVPQGIVVAHKFGIWDSGPDDQLLHDCGIVYHPDAPYLLCIMTRGTDVAKNAEVIGEISRLIYNKVAENDNLTGQNG